MKIIRDLLITALALLAGTTVVSAADNAWFTLENPIPAGVSVRSSGPGQTLVIDKLGGTGTTVLTIGYNFTNTMQFGNPAFMGAWGFGLDPAAGVTYGGEDFTLSLAAGYDFSLPPINGASLLSGAVSFATTGLDGLVFTFTITMQKPPAGPQTDIFGDLDSQPTASGFAWLGNFGPNAGRYGVYFNYNNRVGELPVITINNLIPGVSEPGTKEPPPSAPCGCTDCPPDPKIDPVYFFSGEFYTSAVDLRIKGRGLDFIWSRKYRSRIGPNTAQGNGWDFSYNLFIEQVGSDIAVCDGNTRRDLYKSPGGGPWTRKEFFRELTQNPVDGSHILRFEDTGAWLYHPFNHPFAPGKIAEIIDRNGNRILFDYDLNGRLTTIHDALDNPPTNPRVITIAYNSAGFIASITDWINRSVTYTYYDGIEPGGNFGDLKSVTTPAVIGTPNGNDFPTGKTTIYTYTTAFADENLKHDLLTIRDAKGQLYLSNVYAHTLDPADPRFTLDPANLNYDRVVRQFWGDQNPLTGDIIDLVYEPVTPDVSNNFAVIKVILNDRVGNVNEFFYDTGNRGVIQREYTGRWNPDQPTFNTSIPPIPKLRATDPAFFETRWEWNNDSLRTRIVHPNGNEETFLYDEANPNPRSQGNLLQHCRLPGSHTPAGDQVQICESFQYDDGFGGCCGTNFVTRHVDGRGHQTLHTYDPAGNRLHTTHRIPTIVEDFEYNVFGQTTAHVLPDNGSAHRRRDEYTYYTAAEGFQFGYRKQQIIDAGAGLFNLTTSYEYDHVGNMTRTIDPEAHDSQFVFNQLDQVVRSISAEVAPGSGIRYERDTFYDANDNVVRVDIQNRGDTGGLQPNTHFTHIYEYEILNYPIRMCEEVGDFIGAIPGPTNLPTCTGLPPADFITTEYEYDANRNRTLVRYGEAVNGNQSANVVQTLYDERDLAFHQIRAPGVPGPGGQSTNQYDYDDNKNVATTRQGIENAPRITNNTYDGYDRIVGSVDPMGNTMAYNYDANHNSVSSRTEGELLDTAPGGAGNVRLHETAYVYDFIDRVIRADVQFFDTDTQTPINAGLRPADGLAVTETFWTDNSQVRLILDDNLHATTTLYDTANRVDIVTDPENNTMRFIYDLDSLVVAVTETEKSQLPNPDELFTTTTAYDGLHRLTQTVDNIGNTHVYAYDSRDNLTFTDDALNHETRTGYDGINRLIKTVRDLNGDGANLAAVPGDGNPDIVTTQTWDDTSRLTGQIDDSNNITGYVYDALNRMTIEFMADCTQHAYTYDVHDNRLTMTDANTSVATCTYDLLDRLTGKTIAVGPGVSNDTTAEAYLYDGLSRLVLADDNDSRVTRSYDSLSRVTTEKQNPVPPFLSADNRTVTCLYDGVGNELQSTYPGGRFITCAYDDLDRKQLIEDKTGPPATIATYNYVGPGRVTRREYGNGTRTDYTYDGITGIGNPAGDFGVKRIIGTTHSVIAGGATIDARTYTWDRMYNKLQRKDIRAGGPQLTHSYAYDDIYRLTRTTVTDPVPTILRDEQYDLDGVGNRTTVTGGNDSGPYTLVGDLCAPPADQDVNQYTTTPFDDRKYDENGNLTASFECFEGDTNSDRLLNVADVTPFVAVLLAGGPASCEADLNKDDEVNGLDIQPFTDRLLGLTSPTPLYSIAYDYRNQMVEYNDLSAGRRHTYAYDVFGRRIARVVDADGAAGGPTETRYFYDGWQVCEEQNAAGATQATYVYGLYIDEVLNMQRGSIGVPPVEDFFYHTDELYNVMAVTDAAGSVVERYEYQDYGQPEFFDASDIPIPQSAIANPYLFTGRRYDSETDWYQYRTRYLDPIAGRFTTRDTIGIWEDTDNLGNGYSYVANGPWTHTDPTGLKARTIKFKNCTPSQKKTVKAAVNAARIMAMQANHHMNRLNRMSPAGRAGDASYRRWFGAYNKKRFAKIRRNIGRIKKALTKKDLSFDCCPKDCDASGYAQVSRWDGKPRHTELCPQFWSAPLWGTDSKAGVIVHELSHEIRRVQTEDVYVNASGQPVDATHKGAQGVYGHTAARKLANAHPEAAITNAENYEYFAEIPRIHGFPSRVPGR